MNILTAIRDQLSPELLGQLGKSIGESPEAIKNALGFSLPALIGSAAAKASSPEGASSLFNLLKEKMPHGGWASSATSLLSNFTGSGGNGFGCTGSSLVTSLLGSKASMIQDLIASKAGIRPGSASTLLGAGGQLLMGALGGRIASQGLGPSGFGDLLRSQIPHLQGLVPPELSSMLGISNLLNPMKGTAAAASTPPPPDMTPATTSTRQTVAHAGASPGAKALRWAIVPLALLLGVLLLMHRPKRDNAANAGATADTTWTNQGAANAVSPNIQLPSADTTALTDRLKSAIANAEVTPIDLTGMNFDNSGTLSAAAKAPLATLGRMINDNPSINARIVVYGKTPEEAAARADSIKSWFVGNGGTTQRIAVDPELGDSAVPKVSFSR